MPKNLLPANGSICIGEGSCFRMDVPPNPTAPVTLVKAALHNGSAITLTLRIERSKLIRAIERGTIVVLPKGSIAPAPKAASPSRPYPFEAARARAKARREGFWQRDDILALKVCGLLMTGDKYALLRAAGRTPGRLTENVADPVD